jgi:hypothetical protein
LERINAGRYLDQPVGFRDLALDPVFAIEVDHQVAFAEIVDRITDGEDASDAFGPWNCRQRRAGRVEPLDGQQIGRIDRERENLDGNFVGFGRRGVLDPDALDDILGATEA